MKLMSELIIYFRSFRLNPVIYFHVLTSPEIVQRSFYVVNYY